MQRVVGCAIAIALLGSGATIARAEPDDAASGSGSGSAEQRAADARAKQQAMYELDHEEHQTLAAKRHAGHVELLAGAALTVIGVGAFAIEHSGPTVAVSGGLAFAGVCTLIVGTITTMHGADPNPVVLPPPPLAAGGASVRGAGWSWRF